MPLIDRYGRPIENLRITLTHRCNYKCIYCHMEGEEPSYEELTPEEIERVIKVAVKLGIKRIKFTGGEPLIKKDLLEIIERTSSIEGLVDVAITTNGSLLKQIAKKLAEAKLKRINVNLPSIREETYRKITNSEYTPKQIVEGIIEAKKFGIKLIKVNTVVLKGINDSEIYDLMEFTKRENLILQLIELENIGINNDFFLKHYLDLSLIEERLKMEAKEVIVRRNMQNRRRYILKNGEEVEIVKPYENGSFCSACTRIRLTADGKIKTCLMRNDNLIDISKILKSNLSDVELIKCFIKAIEVREPYWKTKLMF